MVLATEGIPNSSKKRKHFSYKGEWEMCSNGFKRRLAFIFIVIISAKKHLVMHFHTILSVLWYVAHLAKSKNVDKH